MTSVIHINQAPAAWQENPQFVYIGRANPRRGLSASKWGNPFHIGRDGDRDEVIAMYADHLARTGLVRDVAELRGKVLVCWCKPLACHGDVLVELAGDDGE